MVRTAVIGLLTALVLPYATPLLCPGWNQESSAVEQGSCHASGSSPSVSSQAPGEWCDLGDCAGTPAAPPPIELPRFVVGLEFEPERSETPAARLRDIPGPPTPPPQG